MMLEFTTDFLASWRLEGHTHVTYRQWSAGYVTLSPAREDLPIELRILFQCDCFPIYSPVVDEMANNNFPHLFEYYVSENYSHYGNFDPDHIDIEADY